MTTMTVRFELVFGGFLFVCFGEGVSGKGRGGECHGGCVCVYVVF